MPDTKQQARKIIDALPADASWDDIAHALEARAAAEREKHAGKDEGEDTPEQARAHFNLSG